MKKIAIITGSRAEYGLFYPLLKKLKKDKDFMMQLFVTGMHLSPEFGLTYKQIESDGFEIADRVEMLISGDTPSAINKSIGVGLIGFSDVFRRFSPDLAVLLGDRYETFTAATAAFISRIPIAHIHGGELTEGAIDDGLRHSITKMSYIHFVSTDVYRKRVIQLGESPERVFNVGALGLDNLKVIKLLSKDELGEELNFLFGKRNVIVTFHPVTLENNTTEEQILELLGALDNFDDMKIIFTKPNADTHGRRIIYYLEKYVETNPDRAILFSNLGQQRYLSALNVVDMVIGNSSSGIIEAPSFRIPTINIGDRQKGRVMSPAVINCKPIKDCIVEAINQAYSPEFQRLCKSVKNPYGEGDATQKIIKILKDYIYKIQTTKKTFYDIF